MKPMGEISTGIACSSFAGNAGYWFLQWLSVPVF